MPLLSLQNSNENPLALKSVWSCDWSAFGAGNPSVCGNLPEQWSQQQTESGDAEDQQVDLHRDREPDQIKIQ